MHLCDLVRGGEKLPDVLPPVLIPPTFRRTSVSGGGTALLMSPGGNSNNDPHYSTATSPPPLDETKVTSPVSFEDKRKENFDKGRTA